MEIEGEDGSKLSLKPGAETVAGRGKGFDSEDRTVSRRHMWLELDTAEPRVSFEILGKNPVWVRSQTSGKIEIFRKFEKGEVKIGDRFCVSGQRPVWFTLKKREIGNEVVEEEISEGHIGFDKVDISTIDPVKEFGFLVIGKEFEQYPKNRISDIKQWDWFLNEPRKENSDSDDDDDEDQVVIKGKKSTGKKRSRSKGNDDEDWTGESEDDKEIITKTRKFQKPKYSTRSKDPKKEDVKKDRRRRRDDVEEDNDEEEDETLGGFIVDEDYDEVELEEGNESGGEEEDEEEEDFEDED